MKPSLYIETSVVSYLTARPSRDLVTAARQQLTAARNDAMTPELIAAAHADRRDEVIREVRANREAYAARFDYDVRAILSRARARASECDCEVTEREPRRVAVPRVCITRRCKLL